jgi:hypothetical protein
MRVWLISLFGLLVFIGISLWVQYYLEVNTNRLEQKLNRVETSLNSQQWDQADSGLKTVHKTWQKIKPIWSLLLLHSEIDSIDEAMVRTINAVASQNISNARIELGSLQQFVKHIPEREKFSLVNVF